MTSCVVPVSQSGAVLTGGFVRYAGDDWDGVNLLLFQYGTLVPGVNGAAATVTPINITGYQPVGRILMKQRTPYAPNIGNALTDLTVAASTARIVDAVNGIFGFCPRSDATNRMPCLPDDASMFQAVVQIAAKLIDPLGNLGTITKTPILVFQA